MEEREGEGRGGLQRGLVVRAAVGRRHRTPEDGGGGQRGGSGGGWGAGGLEPPSRPLGAHGGSCLRLQNRCILALRTFEKEHTMIFCYNI